MICQLARCLSAHKYPGRVGWMLWVYAEAPSLQTVIKSKTDGLKTGLYFDTPYVSSISGLQIVVTLEKFELLPVFADCEEMSWEAMEANGGEQMPAQEQGKKIRG